MRRTLVESMDALREGMFGEHVDPFLARLRSLGYTTKQLNRKSHMLADLSRWLARRHAVLREFDEALVGEFALKRRRERHRGDGEARTGLQVLAYLRAVRAVAPPRQRLDRARRVQLDFENYLRVERSLGDLSIRTYVRVVRPFLSDYLSDPRRQLRRLQAADVVRAVIGEVPATRLSAARSRVSPMRALLRYLYVAGETPRDLSTAVPSVAGWRLATVPKFLRAQDVQRLLRCCDRANASGRREYAVLLLLARLGLRANEVATLTLDDLDWGAGELVVHGKGGREDRIPLPSDVGLALAEYLRRVRPRCPSRRLFLTRYAPCQGLTREAVYGIVRRAIVRSGLEAPGKGPHVLRHSLATELLRRGGSLAEIGDLLRHRRAETTAIYAKVDFAALRQIAPPWPVGTR